MLKFFFWILLLVNAALFAWQRGYLEAFLPSGHEPARVANQLNADKIRVVPEPQARRAAPVPAPSPEPAVAAEPATVTATAVAAAAPTGKKTAQVPEKKADAPVAAKKPEVIACTEIGNFSVEEAKRFSAQLASLSLGERVKQRTVSEAVSHIVYIPPQGDKEGAEKKAGELRRLGINDFFVIQGNSSLRWGISLGVFKMEEAARAHLADLNQKGVHSARIGERGVISLVAFQLRELQTDEKAGLERIKAAEFPKQRMRSCEAAAER